MERFYWREIRRTYFASVVAWLEANGLGALRLLEFKTQYPAEDKRLRTEARERWKAAHRNSPLYDTAEESQQAFLARCPIPIEAISGEYEVVIARNGHRLGRWQCPSGDLVLAEGFARRHFEEAGWTVFDCERKLIATLYTVLFSSAIQDPTDPKILHTVRNSTLGWSKQNPHTPRIHLLLPADFGTPVYFRRRGHVLHAVLDEIRSTASLESFFEARVGQSAPLRDYLNAHAEEVALARATIRVIPRETLANMLEWTATSFWDRIHGWPDLLLLRAQEYRFIEVKSPEDRLSKEQMRWFEWAGRSGVPAAICQLRRKEP